MTNTKQVDEKALEAVTAHVWKDEHGALRETWKNEHREMFEIYESAKAMTDTKPQIDERGAQAAEDALEQYFNVRLPDEIGFEGCTDVVLEAYESAKADTRPRVSLIACAMALQGNQRIKLGSDLQQIAKAVLDAAGVEYAD